jgi:uncharacterized membrane protein
MNGATKTAGQASESISGHPLMTAQRALLGVFLIAIGVLIAQTFGVLRLPVSVGLCDSLVLFLALASTLVSLAGQLPAQNVGLAAAIVASIGSTIHMIGALTGIPFGPVVYTSETGLKLFGVLPWFMPLLWVVVIFNARGVARLILRPWRKLRVYGYWLIGLTAVLTLIFVLGLEPFATRARGYWIWQSTKLPVDWFGTPLSDFLGWVVAALLILGFSTPALMKKRPAKSFPEYHPLLVWIAMEILFVAGALSHHLTAAAAVSAVACVLVIPFAVRGARW